MLIDTPGFSDTNKSDEKISSLMTLRLFELKYVNSILVVLNSQQPRLDANL